MARSSITLRGVLTVALVAVGLAVMSPSLSGQQRRKADKAPAGKAASKPASTVTDSYTKEEIAKIAAQVVVLPEVAATTKGHQVRIIRVAKEAEDHKTTTGAPPRQLAHLVLRDDTTGKAERIVFDPASGKLVSREPIEGAPAPSEEELEEASQIAGADAEVARLVKEGAHVTGGFIATAPAGARPNHRYLQFQVLSADRRKMQRVVVVDLTTRTVASPSSK
ncbi:MAG TPA: hypothetical protein VGZ22_30585 [Isosphaeraceae bacterium]|nr:hypothetical protein [Isosphaeraceae bacterium]